ncbi:AraC family transcriptional regulator [Nibrella saemangeumensis]|uniref:AraC family transcriptional regulator n=1 Tax=Nibrella saemangeumensis TaxID=1084526 RepID=A0ABP8M9W5_9BACT
MKPQLLKVPIGIDYSFSVRQDKMPYFYNRWHYHPEIELIHIETGTGTQLIGDSIQNFQDGDVLLVGSNLPHYWRSEDRYFAGQPDMWSTATVVHFQENFWGERFLYLPENRPIRTLLDKAKAGIRVTGTTQHRVQDLLARLLTAPGSERILLLLTTLQTIALSSDVTVLSSSSQFARISEAEADQINRIYAYSIANFQRKISLEEIAEVANVSPNSFCRYFKSRTRKTYSQFLLELRIGHACRLLLEGKLSIAQVCYESGFNNFSNFNKYFKEHTGLSPLKYQQQHRS